VAIGTNPSDFDGDQDSNPQFMDPDDPDHVHIAAVYRVRCVRQVAALLSTEVCAVQALIF